MTWDEMPGSSQPDSVSTRLHAVLRDAMAAAGGWLPFERFMALVLYSPGLGYYANDARQFGRMPASGSDFVTAPELSPHFGRALARQVAQGLAAADSDCVTEFGAGSGALAEQLIDTLGHALQEYRIVELSATLRERQAHRLARFGTRVRWLDRLPDTLDGVLLGNEVLDAMPVRLIHRAEAGWCERGVALGADGSLVWADRPSDARPPVDGDYPLGMVTELHPQAEAFVRTLGERLGRGLMLWIDYGFPEAEYYHPQRHQGTLMCHRAHRADADPLVDLGLKDITAHVNFTGLALAAQAVGLEVLGYTSQARFLVNCGLVEQLADAPLAERAMAQKLITEHEMGELFKVIAFGRGVSADWLGFSAGDRTHRL